MCGGDKIRFGFDVKDCVVKNFWCFRLAIKLNYLGNGLFGFRYDNVGYIVSIHGAGWIRKERKRESYNFSNMMAIEQTKPVYK